MGDWAGRFRINVPSFVIYFSYNPLQFEKDQQKKC